MVAAISTHRGGQHFDYSLMSSHRCFFMQDAITKIVDSPLMLIFRR